MRVPDVQRAHLGEAGHRLSVGRHRRQRRGTRIGLGEAVVARRDREARRHALHVVLERPGKRLVEVVQVEQQGPLGRRDTHRSWRDARRRSSWTSRPAVGVSFRSAAMIFAAPR